MFKKAERTKTYLKIALVGVSGCGKTYSALLLAKGLGGKIAMIDTENGSGSLYSTLCEYDICSVEAPFATEKYIAAIEEAEAAGYNVLIIDSLSHAWAAEGGLLEQVDKKAAKSSSGNSFTAWRDVTPKHNKLVSSILQAKMDVIVTMRAKTAYEIETNEKGKKVPVKRGLAPIQRDGLEYEFTVVFDLDKERHYAEASKDRTGLFDGQIDVINQKTGKLIRDWVNGAGPAEGDNGKKIFVEVKGQDCFVLTSKGMVNVKDISADGLVKLMNLPQYEPAWQYIDELLNGIEEAETNQGKA
ncbi:MAG: AAA family ATPase [Acidaminococcaceae bacterium]